MSERRDGQNDMRDALHCIGMKISEMHNNKVASREGTTSQFGVGCDERRSFSLHALTETPSVPVRHHLWMWVHYF
jgi:hypothetical protein